MVSQPYQYRDVRKICRTCREQCDDANDLTSNPYLHLRESDSDSEKRKREDIES